MAISNDVDRQSRLVWITLAVLGAIQLVIGWTPTIGG